MAIWPKDSTPSRKDDSPDPVAKRETDGRPDYSPAGPDSSRRPTERAAKESIIAAELTIEGKIEGAGHVRLAGRFKGDVDVQGDLTIEAGAKLTGSVRAGTVIVAGELDGNIEAAERVELRETGVLSGDLKAGSLTVAAGSRMRGQVEFGWTGKEKSAVPPKMKLEPAAAP
jgi:cytoskeletal protein CcmA (bactofilin family)